MKAITNWRKATVADFESNDLLDNATCIWVLSYQMLAGEVKSIDGRDHGRMIKFFEWHMDNNVPVVFHNGISFDIPLAEKILGVDLKRLMVIDTLAVSWYLNPDRRQHGLDSFFDDYGIAKPPIADWTGVGVDLEEHHATMANRCQEDVKINQALWKDLMNRLTDMYIRAQEVIDNGQEDQKTGNVLNVGGTRITPDEWIPVDDMVGRSVDEAIDSILTFLMFKMDCARLQEKTRWEVDVERLNRVRAEVAVKCEEFRVKLEGVMPKVPQYKVKKKPAKTHKDDGTISKHGEAWEKVLDLIDRKPKDIYGNEMVVENTGKEGGFKILSGYKDPSANSPVQVKDFLYSKGWVPLTFKYEKDEVAFTAWIAAKPKDGARRGAWTAWKDSRPAEREIPQITKAGDDGKELCESVIDLAEEVPEIMLYADYNVAKHRLSVLDGFSRDLREGKWLQARIGGFTNTLRVKHRELVNLPGIDKAFGGEVRGVLIAGRGMCLLGSDLSSLEDRVKHHFMLPHDPEYVKTMQAEDYDPHIMMALIAKMVTQLEFDEFMKGNKSANAKASRKKGKTTNYASVYNAGPAAIARAAGVSLKEGEILHKAYWELNWAVKAIADEQVVITDAHGKKWLVNPINGFLYALRKESDRFSTLAQGTGSYFFDMWVDNTLTEMEKRYSRKTLTGSFHDEMIACVRDRVEVQEEFSGIIQQAILDVNKKYNLRRALGCDTQVGYKYSEIH